MGKNSTTDFVRRNWGGGGSLTLRALLFVALVLPMLTLGIAPASTRAAAAHPLLLRTAAQTPDAQVSVIVQKGTANREPEGLVARLGGKVTKDLSIINAFAANLTARAAIEVARADGVRWVSPNSPVQESVDQSTTWATELAPPITSTISANFTEASMAGDYLWFNSAMNVTGAGTSITINFEQVQAVISFNGEQLTVSLPDAAVTYSATALVATTQYDAEEGRWVTTLPLTLLGQNVFLTGGSVRLATTIPDNASVTFSGRFTSNVPGARVTSWKWSAATYRSFNSDNALLGVKPCDNALLSQWLNSDKAGTPENYKSYVSVGGRGNSSYNYTGDYSSAGAATPAYAFTSASSIVDAGAGANDTYGYGSGVAQTFTGFGAEHSPGQRIERVEVALKAYVPIRLLGIEDVRVRVRVGGYDVSVTSISNGTFDSRIGLANASLIYADVTGGRNWTWADLDNELQVTIEHPLFTNVVYYDAVGLRVTAVDGVDTSGGGSPTSRPNVISDPTRLASVYPRVVKATDVWTGVTGPARQGQGVTVAVVDSGVVKTKDMRGRVIASVNFNDQYRSSADKYGHGTFVAGIIAGDGKASDRRYMGVAPRTNILNARVSGDDGMATEADVVESLQWVLENKDRFGVRVVNISLNSSVMQSYHTSPLCAADEVLWFNGIVVVVSAGNNGNANLYPPANDPFVITVGATDDRGTVTLSDDTIASFSAYGTAETGATKPELVAPGRNIVSLLPDNRGTTIGILHPLHRVNDNYFKMSGTSMAAPMVSGAVALLLQDEPNLNPDQVKARLMSTASGASRWAGYDAQRAGAGIVDAAAALSATSTTTANTGVRASQLLWTGSEPITWGSVNWNSVNWNSVNWNSVNWNSVNWNSVNWNSDHWEP